MTLGPITMSYDSAHKQDAMQEKLNPMAKTIGAMVGKSLTATFDADGNCLSIEGFREMMQDAFKNIPGGKEMAKAFIPDDKEAAAQQFFGTAEILPKHPVKIGDIWSSQQKLRLGPLGEVVTKTKSKLIGIETVDGRRFARVAMTMNMDLDNSDKPMEIAGTKMKIHHECRGGTGSYLWDLDRHLMVRMKQTYPMEMRRCRRQTGRPDPTGNGRSRHTESHNDNSPRTDRGR